MINAIANYFLVRIYKLLPIETLLGIFQRISAFLAYQLFYREWKLRAYGLPKFFKHQINLNRWIIEPSRWSFTARGVYAREKMFKGCTVLDLCCGDGSYSYLFFSDIAGRVDAVDNDLEALAYARRCYAAPGIQFHCIDIVEQPFPQTHYDIVVWNAAICYFNEKDIRKILGKIVHAGKSSMVLCGMLPRASGYADHKKEFRDRQELDALLSDYFKTVAIREVDEVTNIFFYFYASSPKEGYTSPARRGLS